MNWWGIHATTKKSPFLSTGVIVLVRAGIGDLSSVGPDREAIKEELRSSYPSASPGTIRAWAGVLLRYAFEAQVGDGLVHPEKSSETLSLGTIASEYFWEAPDRHCRRVNWTTVRASRSRFPDEARREASGRQAFFAIPDRTGTFTRRAS